MPSSLLDTPVLAASLLGRSGAVSLVAPWIEARDAATSILVYGEVAEYVRRRPDFEDLRTQLRRLLRHVNPYLVTYPIMERYAAVRLQLRPRGELIGDVDTLIAATALERDLTLVTTDSDFRRVPNLKLELVTRQQILRL